MAGILPRDQNHVTAVGFESSSTPGLILAGKINEITGRILTSTTGGGGSGTVQTVGVATANGFAGTSDGDPADPVLTLSTTITGILKGNGTAISAVTIGSGLTFDGTTLTATGSGTVTTVSVATANGFAGSVANATTTPAITLTTSINAPVLAGNGTAIAAATTTGSGSTVVLSTSPTLVTPILGTPTSGTLTNCTGLPVATGISGLGTGVATALAVNVGSAGAFVVNGGALGTPSSGTVTNLTGTASININGTVGATTPTTGVFTTLVANAATSLLLGTAGSAVGSVGFRNATSGTITLAPTTGALGTVTLTLPAITDTLVTLTATQTLTNKTLTSPTLTTPVLGTPSSGTLTNCTGLPIAGLVSSTSTALGVGSLELGNASDTTLSRSSAGVLAVEGVVIPSISSTNTLTNKRVTPRVNADTSNSATPTNNTDNFDVTVITGQTNNITSMTTNLSGTPTNGQMWRIAMTAASGTPTVTWGSSFEDSTVTAPTALSTTRVDVGFVYNSATSKWRCVARA